MSKSDVGGAKPLFDPDYKFVTSYLLSPTVLAGIRIVLAFFCLGTILFGVIAQAVNTPYGGEFFSYFTNLTFIGLCAYFFASGVQTIIFAESSRLHGSGSANYPLQRWHRVFQYLHVLLFSTIVTFPLLVTVVYWALIASPSTFSDTTSAYNSISKHALNTVFALFEITLTNVEPLPWLHLPVTIVLLGGYVGVAYITYATQHFYPYSFLDPKKQGAKLAGYIVGIAVGQVVFFVLAWALIKLRVFLVLKHQKARETNDPYASDSDIRKVDEV